MNAFRYLGLKDMDCDLRESEFMMLQDCPDAETLRRYLAGDEKISDFKTLG